MLSALVFLPLAGALVILLFLNDARQIRLWAVAVTVVELALAIAVFAILAGTGSIVGEENQGTLDILLAQPVSRLRLIATKMVGLALANGMVVAILLAMFWVTVPFLDLEVRGRPYHGSIRTALAFPDRHSLPIGAPLSDAI